MKRAIAVLWSFLVAWVFSALFLSTDYAVGGVEGLFSLSIVLSVTSWSLVLLVPVFLCLLAFSQRGRKGLVLLFVSFSVVLGGFLALGGTTAKTPEELAVSVGGMVVILALVIGLALLPHLVMFSRNLVLPSCVLPADPESSDPGGKATGG